MRTAELSRTTKETDIKLKLSIDGSGLFSGTSGIGFFDHMLNSFCVHSGFDISLECMGDLHVDCHHTIEDIGIVLGTAFCSALSEKSGIKRYGNSFIPMDEALAHSVVDISGRPFLVFDAEFKEQRVGDMDSCMTTEFFRAFAFNSKITLHMILLYGSNAHHGIEALFKSASHALREAASLTDEGKVLSSKGVI